MNDITRMQLEGLIAIQWGDADGGVALLREAAETEASLPYEFGPPRLPVPGYEALGLALLELGRTDEAREALEMAEERTPGRLTLARARAAMASDA